MNEFVTLLNDSVEGLLGRLAEPSRPPVELGLANEFRSAGLDLALVSEAAGGSGLPLSAASAIARGWGRYAAPMPVVEMLLAPHAAEICDRMDIAATATLAQLRGDAVEAPLFEGCQHVLIPSGDAVTVVRVDDTEPAGQDLADTRWVRLTDAGTPLQATGLKERLRRDAALLTTAYSVGAMEKVLELVVEHVNTREQFGRPLGKFQAVQNLIADAATEVKVAASALTAALTLVDDASCSPLDWLAAKAQAGRACGIVAANAHQTMGAIGFTEEHVLHFYSKALWCSRDNWGSETECETEIGRIARNAGSAGLWSLLTDGR